MRTRTRISDGLLWGELFLDSKSYFPKSSICEKWFCAASGVCGPGAAHLAAAATLEEGPGVARGGAVAERLAGRGRSLGLRERERESDRFGDLTADSSPLYSCRGAQATL